MDPVWYVKIVIFFVLGSIIGSFLNVCIYRLPRDKSPWHPQRSYCPHCHQMIAWFDNIPLVSWFVLRAQCRHCGSYISSRYVVVEFLTAALFAVTYAVMSKRGEAPEVMAVYLALISVLIMASFIDLELRIIPDSITLGGAFVAPLVSVLVPRLHLYDEFGGSFLFTPDNVWGPLAASLMGMVLGAGATWGAGVAGKLLFRREAMGFGDVKFMALLGGLLGPVQVMLIFFVAPVLGAVIGLIHLARTRDHHIPYGPFLSIAAFVVMLWGDKILALIGVTRYLM